MAKRAKRFGLYIGVVTVLVLILLVAPLAQPDPPGDPSGSPELGWAARYSLGLGPCEVLPALAGDRLHKRMIQVGLSHVGQHEAELAEWVEVGPRVWERKVSEWEGSGVVYRRSGEHKPFVINPPLHEL